MFFNLFIKFSLKIYLIVFLRIIIIINKYICKGNSNVVKDEIRYIITLVDAQGNIENLQTFRLYLKRFWLPLSAISVYGKPIRIIIFRALFFDITTCSLLSFSLDATTFQSRVKKKSLLSIPTNTYLSYSFVLPLR